MKKTYRAIPGKGIVASSRKISASWDGIFTPTFIMKHSNIKDKSEADRLSDYLYTNGADSGFRTPTEALDWINFDDAYAEMIAEEDEEVTAKTKYRGKSNKRVSASTDPDEYSNIKVDVYDIAKFVEQDTDGKYALFNYDDGAAILFKPDGSGCIVDYEAIGEAFDSMSDTIVLEFTDVPEKGKIFIAPQYQANVSIKEIMDKSPHKTMTVDEFFTKRNYNSRCINNFNGIKEYLK